MKYKTKSNTTSKAKVEVTALFYDIVEFSKDYIDGLETFTKNDITNAYLISNDIAGVSEATVG